ncbi:MAG: amidohydrolase family protein [Gammaproteobacteria bacterium]|nr:amidohydrolase family protein [Gammaproteobacteria bacterium]
MATITLFKAKKIITMNPRQPVADYVAVRDGIILGTGSLDSLAGWGDYEIDNQFADKVILPGFIEGHCHSWEGAAWEDTYVGFLDRTSPTREVHPGLKSIGSVVEKLKKANHTLTDPTTPVKGWGLDPIFFERRVTCADLDQISTTRPVVVIHQSGHIINVNSYVLDKAGIDGNTDVDGLVTDGHGELTGELMGIALYQTALKAIGMNSILDMGENAERSLWWFANSAQIAGVTTVTDLASELSPEMVTVQQSLAALDSYPIRVVPAFMGQMVPSNEGVEKMLNLKKQSTPKLQLGLVKLIVDGSIQGFTARLKTPGYYNGAPNGLWYVDPTELPSIIEAYHSAGLQIHIHTNGDEATEEALDAIEQVLKVHPDSDARFTLQHCQMAHDAHFKRMARLGVCANLFANHLYYWGDQHYETTMGPERAARMDAANSAGRLGVNYSIHSDAPVTHLSPLFTAWCGVNRRTYSGRILGEPECISVQEALHAVTLGAAFTLKLDSELGSIECGKRADFTILEDDPLTIDPMKLKDITVWGTVLDGRVFPVSEIGRNMN